MKYSVTCYPTPANKKKARDVCEAFAAGVERCGDRAYIYTEPPKKLERGAAVFYGVRPANAHLWEQAQREGRDWYYIDNAYFDADREKCFRVTKNAVQMSGPMLLPVAQMVFDRRFNGEIKPWRKDGEHIVICPQSDEFMRTVVGFQGDWAGIVMRQLKALTQRPLRLRRKDAKRALAEDLENAWALVTHMSAAAIEAAIAGVPVFCTGRCAASAVAMNHGLWSFARIEERPSGIDIRHVWAEGLARCQWTLTEMRRGDCWRALNAG